MTFTPRLEVLPDAQRALWPALAGIPDSCVLYGGTALALRLGHPRLSTSTSPRRRRSTSTPVRASAEGWDLARVRNEDRTSDDGGKLA